MIISDEIRKIIDDDERAGFALRTARILEDVMMHFYHKKYEVEWDSSEKYPAAAIKLEIDKKCDLLARTFLTALYPISSKWGFVGEESFYPSELKKEFYWCVDPICGSLGYNKKTGNFGTSVALVHNSKAILGVMNSPVRNWTGIAVVHPDKKAALSPAFKRECNRRHLIVSANKKDLPNLQAIVKRMEPTEVTYAESLPVKSLGTLNGMFDLFYGLPSDLGGGKYNIWDIAATMAFADATGCILTDAYGKELTIDPEAYHYYDGIIMTFDEDLYKKSIEETLKQKEMTG